MTFKEAKIKLAKVADGKYHSLTYEETIFPSGRTEQKCSIYIDGENSYFNGSTWENAFWERLTVLGLGQFAEEGQPE